MKTFEISAINNCSVHDIIILQRFVHFMVIIVIPLLCSKVIVNTFVTSTRVCISILL